MGAFCAVVGAFYLITSSIIYSYFVFVLGAVKFLYINNIYRGIVRVNLNNVNRWDFHVGILFC